MKQVVLGVDIGGTNTKVGFVDKDGSILESFSMSTRTNCSVDKFLDELLSQINKFIVHKKWNIVGVGIGAPSSNQLTGQIIGASNLGWGDVIPLVDRFKSRSGFKNVILCNDANSAAIGEMFFGGAKGMRNFIMLTLGTGVGSGIVVNGQILLGNNSFAGELGHTIVIENGRECGCGRKGCLESYASASGICKTAIELLVNSTIQSSLRELSFSDITSKKIFESAEMGDQIALQTFQKTGEILGKAIANFVVFSDPQAIFLFGGVMAAQKYLLKSVTDVFNQNICFLYKGKVQILLSQLDGSNSAILGASAMAWQMVNETL